MGALAGRDDGGVADQRVVDTRIGDQVGLELVEVDVQGTVKSQGRGDGADDLGNEAVHVLIIGTWDVQIPSADVVDGLIVHQEGAVGVFNGAVSRQDRVVRLDDSGRDTGSRVHRKFELDLFPVLGGETLEQKSAKPRAGTTTKGVEDQKPL